MAAAKGHKKHKVLHWHKLEEGLIFIDNVEFWKHLSTSLWLAVENEHFYFFLHEGSASHLSALPSQPTHGALMIFSENRGDDYNAKCGPHQHIHRTRQQ